MMFMGKELDITVAPDPELFFFGIVEHKIVQCR